MKTTLYILTALLILSTVSATRVGNINEECQRYGFDFGIAKWEYHNRQFYLEGTQANGTFVNGTSSKAFWWANPAVDGVLSKEGQNTYVLPGGSTGIVIPGSYQDKCHAISHITFCGNEDEEEVPEFGTLAALGVLVAAGLFIAKKRK